MNIAVDWNIKRLFKQTNKVSLQRAGSLRYKYFLLSVSLLSYHVIPMEKSHYARFSLLYIQNRTFYSCAHKSRSIRLNFPLAGEISRWFRREKSQVISANCAKVGF